MPVFAVVAQVFAYLPIAKAQIWFWVLMGILKPEDFH